MDLLGTETLYIYELIEVILFGEIEDFMLAVFQVLVPSFKGFNNSQKIFIVGFLPAQSWDHLSGKKDYGMPLANFASAKIWVYVSHVRQNSLAKNSTNKEAWYVCFNPDMMFQIKMIENRWINEHFSLIDEYYSLFGDEKTRSE